MERMKISSVVQLIACVYFFLMLFSGCKTLIDTRGSAPLEPQYKVVDDTVVVTEKTDPMIHWIFVKCDYWAGCYVRCEGSKNHCLKVVTAVEPVKYLELSRGKTDH